MSFKLSVNYLMFWVATPHQEYLALGNNAKTRNAFYIELFKTEIDDKLLETFA